MNVVPEGFLQLYKVSTWESVKNFWDPYIVE